MNALKLHVVIGTIEKKLYNRTPWLSEKDESEISAVDWVANELYLNLLSPPNILSIDITDHDHKHVTLAVTMEVLRSRNYLSSFFFP